MPKTHVYVLTAIMLTACLAPGENDHTPTTPSTQATENAESEPVAEAQEGSLGGLLCGGFCASAGGVACALVADTCATATAVTVGAASIPCAIALVGSCLGTLACMSLCAYDTPGAD